MSASLRRAEFAAGAPWRPGLPPGVYEARASAPTSATVRLDTAAFIGLARMGPLNTPVPLESWPAFVQVFGDALPGLKLPQAVHAFFAEGGRRCLVVRCLDHLNARTARFELPGLSIAHRLAARRLVRIAARNPGAWGHALTLRVTARRRALPLEPLAGAPPRWAMPAHRAIMGATLRLPAAGGAWHLAHIAAVAPHGVGTARVELAPEPGAAFLTAASGAGAEEVLLDLEVALDGRVRERWTDTGLHHLHPRFLPRLLGRRAPAEALLPPPIDGRDPDSKAGSPELYWGTLQDPPGSALLRPSAWLRDQWLLPSEALLAASDGLTAAGDALVPVRQGRDSAETFTRAHFLAPTGITALHRTGDLDHRFLVFADRPGALDALAQWDERQPRAPVALVVLPDLLHPAPPEAPPREPPPEPGAPCFGACGATPAPRAPRAPDWPNLGGDLTGLRDIQAEVLAHTERAGPRIALFDLPPGLTPGEIAGWRRALASSRAALYAPWLRAADARDARAPAVLLPPAAAAAGIAARIELERHVWHAPANARLRAAFALAEDPGLPDAGFLHEERVDVIRPTEQGLMLLGARTTALDPEWTHLSVRRLMDWLATQIALDIGFAPFEPNGPALWGALRRAAERRLRAVFDAGGLAGRSAAQAYFARCDASTTPPAAQDAGQAVLLVGVAPAVPAEFLVFRLVRGAAGEVSA
ncbi:MAG: phage tail sheath subtilisin-like domain-containing protein [Rubritepida sp.]|nr:phage tail sheath subtilisin-like domain-containing protein [Rubritepida sp.]